MYWRKFQRISISTHSLTRRLTHTCVRCSMRHWHFNSQPHKEADVIMQSESYHHLHVNSQPHKEADKINQSEKTGNKYFNSQPHKEADD